jgi:hypothetical protein
VFFGPSSALRFGVTDEDLSNQLKQSLASFLRGSTLDPHLPPLVRALV